MSTRDKASPQSLLSAVSHELRAPLANIREGIAQVLDGLHGPPTENQAAVLGSTLSELDRLTRYITDVLDAARVTEGQPDLRWQRVDVVRTLRDAVAAFTSEIAGKGLALKEDYPAPEIFLYGDNDELLRLFLNIVGNAVKFTSEGHVTVTVRQTSNMVSVSVSDTGIGVSREDLANMFTRFGQFSADEEYRGKGSGLGLMISKGIMDRHGGRIRAESLPRSGTTITMEFRILTVLQAVSRAVEDVVNRETFPEPSVSLAVFRLCRADVPDCAESRLFPRLSMDTLATFIRSKLRRRGDLALADEGRVISVLPATAKGNALIVTARIRQMAAEAFPELQGHGLALACSVFNMPEDADTASRLLARVFPAPSRLLVGDRGEST